MAFHRRFQAMLQSIPETGLTRDQFRRVLAPFVASIGDAHTVISSETSHGFGGIPLLFYVVEDCLYVAGVLNPSHASWFGSKLVSVEGVPLAQIFQRTKRIRAADNDYGTLAQLGNFDLLLNDKGHLKELVPEWTDEKYVQVDLETPDGLKNEVTMAIPKPFPLPFIKPESRLTLPWTAPGGFAYILLEPDKKTAYLRVADMVNNRETFEKRSTYENVAKDAASLYRSIRHDKAPKLLAATLAGLPSLTEAFREMVLEMRTSQTEALVIDLRNNVGGWALAADILVYFLFGKEALVELYKRTNIVTQKYSPHYYKQSPELSLRELNQVARSSGIRSFDLVQDDYDFSAQMMLENGKLNREYVELRLAAALKRSPTFYAEFESGKYSQYYKPPRIVVACNAATFSAGFMFLKYFDLLGAIVVGVPPSQSVNHFGEIVPFRLKNTRVEGQVSHSFLVLDRSLLDDPKNNRVLKPHFELTYKRLVSYGFDRHSEILLAIDVLGRN